MKIFVFKPKKSVKYLMILIGILVFISVAGFMRQDAIGVFSTSKELPIYSVESDEKIVAITFDCAWGADDIPDIISTLKDENIKATFFIVGEWAEKYPESVRMISDAGHDVANHSYSHLRMGAIPDNKIRSEISLCDKKLSELSGQKVNLFRPPFGDYNNAVITTARELNYYTIQWDVDSLDWKPGISSQEITRRVCGRVKPGSIILFHNDTAHTAKILPEIISSLKKEGYGFMPVSKLILKDNYYIDFDGTQKAKK